jgi:hypothetical protein
MELAVHWRQVCNLSCTCPTPQEIKIFDSSSCMSDAHGHEH